MRRVARAWKNLSISKKLYGVVGIMAILIVGELVALRFSLHTLSAVRALVAAEGLWSKAQKDALLNLQRFEHSRDEKDYRTFQELLRVPDGDSRARLELEKPNPDLAVIRDGFLQGGFHPSEIDGVVNLLLRFNRVSYISRAIEAWTAGDRLLGELKETAELLRRFPKSARSASARIVEINRELTRLEDEFSRVLSEGARWLERIVLLLLFIAVIAVETVGITLAFLTSRSISSGLRKLNEAAQRIGSGKFGGPLAVDSGDEIGKLALSLQGMDRLLENSYRDLERRVAERTAQLEAALRSREEFLAIASHELKTPLTSLHLSLQLLERSPGSDPERRLSVSLQQARKLSSLIQELLDLTQILNGKLEIHRKKDDLARVVRETASSLEEEAGKAGSRILVRADEAVPCEFDALRVGQVVTNLLSNAIKYGEGKPIEVSAEARGDLALVVVADHGVGIPPAEQGRIFERFERLSSRRRVGGLGLGLYIARQIMEAHGGRIRVESRPGEGATFIAEFPPSRPARESTPLSK